MIHEIELELNAEFKYENIFYIMFIFFEIWFFLIKYL